MKLLLTCPPIFNHVYTPSLPLGYLKAYVQKYAEVEVKALNLEYSYFSSPFIKKSAIFYWDKIWFRDHGMKEEERPIYDKFVSQIMAERPDAVGFSVAHSNLEVTRYISQKLRYLCPKIYIIYGGRYFCLRESRRHWVVDYCHKNFPDVDCIIKNEGEETLCEIVKTLKSGLKPTFCKGATLRSDNGAIIDGGNRDLIKDLDTIPFPDFSDFPRENYLSDYVRILFSRGCIGQCVYCVENDMMGTIRYRSPGNVVEELKLRLSQGYKKFQVCDLAVNSCLRPLLDICKEIIAHKLDVEFVFVEFRNAPGLTKEVFELLVKAGFGTLCFGTESGSQRILDSMGKGVKVKTIDQNFKDAHSAGLKVILYLMTGFPGETEETFLETIDLIRRNQEFLDG
ncbi:MAG: radical SAM protein, partial [Candidatus Omnitrophota bacterium]